MTKPHFSGYATRANIKCADGRVILKDAFKTSDGVTVPLVWQHFHDSVSNVLGHAVLQNREDGVYALGYFNDTPDGQIAHKLVANGDITFLSIYANELQQDGPNVKHGVIREVSLVLAGANPGATIDYVNIVHGSDATVTISEDEAVIRFGEAIEHAASEEASSKDLTVPELFNSLTEEQKTLVYAIVGNILDDVQGSDNSTDAQHSISEEENLIMTNVFENNGSKSGPARKSLTHDQFVACQEEAIGKKTSLRQTIMAHAAEYGFDNIGYLFPEAQTSSPTPEMISRDQAWVGIFMNKTKHLPFSRVKSVVADITADEARAKGYVKGALKKEEIIALLKRVTEPTTVYKKQKLDRDDVLDITDFNVVAWMKEEMRVMHREEIARAGLIGDGRDAEDPDKIDSTRIRPIWTDAEMYAIHTLVDLGVNEGYGEILDEIVRARIDYKGSGNPTLFAPPTVITECMLLKDTTGRRIFNTEAELAAYLRVSEIVEVPVMEDQTRTVSAVVRQLLAIIVNPIDYAFGADRGGETSFFEDFDIDYNQQKYLLEARTSGALTKPASALVVELDVTPAG